ncbi:MAG: hypothetical protein V4625_01600 [Pseudomonadota bacterium]
MRYVLGFLLLFGTACALAADLACQVPTPTSPVLAQAERLVQQLPETANWSRSHAFPVAYIGSFQPVSRLGQCFLAVAVYANRPERYESWNLFYVNVESKTILVAEPASGDVVTLKAWRNTKR